MDETIRPARVNARRTHGMLEACREKPDMLGKIIAWAALVAVFVHATQAGFDVLGWTGKGHLNLGLADVVIGVAFVLWLVRRIALKDFSVPAVSAAAVCGVAWLALSLVPQLKGGGPDDAAITVSVWGVKEVIQFFAYFIAGFIIFAESFRDRDWLERSVMALGLTTLLSLSCGLGLYFSESADAVAVRGAAFANRNTFGGFLAMALPLLFGVGLFSRQLPQLITGILILLGGLCVCLAGGPVLAICVGVLVVAFLRGKAAFAIAAVALVLLGWQVLPRMTRDNPAVLLDSVLFYKETDPYGIYKRDVTGIRESLAEKRRRLAGKIAEAEAVDRADVPTEEDLSYRWQQRYKEWQAALNMMARSPLFGVGVGCYQVNVGKFYYQQDPDGTHRMPKYAKNLIEPDTHSGYMVWGATAGVPFIIIVLAMLTRAAKSAGRAFVSQTDRLMRGVAAGILGSLAAVVVLSVFSDPLVRGVGVTLALVLALAEVVRRNAGVAEVSGNNVEEERPE